ncbi:MAG: DUF2207 domain-containing protein [Sphingomicrobium sp.]
MKRLFAALAALLLVPAAARAEERITSFASDIRIAKNGMLDVTETIEVIAEGIAIRHGIYRDFPTVRRVMGQPGGRASFTPIDVRRDGQDEPYRVENISGGVRVRIGSADTDVAPGAHRYTIHYQSQRQVGHFPDFDELYWNVTGNGWSFPIDRAEARITLPSPTRFTRTASYTGPAGATGSSARLIAQTADSISYATTGPLAPREGMTVAVGWPKGVVDGPSAASMTIARIADYLPWLFGAGGLVWLLAYYARTWLRIGRDPRKGTMVPLFSPPDDLSPAALRYILKRGFDDRSVAASLVSLGIRGKLKLVEEEGGIFSSNKKRLDRLNDDVTGLPSEEAKLFHGLMSGRDSIELDQENHEIFSAAREGGQESLKSQFGERFYVRNARASLAGLARLAMLAIALLVVIVVAAMAVSGDGPAVAFAFSSKAPLLLLLPAIPVALAAFGLMGAPTREGRAMMDRILGFKHYLSVAERERLDRMQAPEETLTLFEKYLPHAIALEVETRWAKRFQSQIAAALASPASRGTALSWYSGPSSPWNDIGGFTSSVGDSLASSLGSASASPSSGSGGGGSSGGGGGGGGGGGW